MSNLDAEQSTEAVANALREASDRLEALDQRNQDLKARFETEQWSGMDQINTASTVINEGREKLVKLADDIGVGGQIVREARQRAQMVGSYDSVAG